MASVISFVLEMKGLTGVVMVISSLIIMGAPRQMGSCMKKRLRGVGGKND